MDLITILYIVAGSTTALFVVRLGLMMFGLGEHHDIDVAGGHAHDLQDVADFKILTLQTVIVTLMAGGWISLLLLDGLKWHPAAAVGLGGAIGFVVALAFGYALFSMRKLESDGTIRDFKAEGLTGMCYVRVPEAGKGKGQVQVTVQNHTLTLDAVSDGPAIESFKKIVVMGRLDKDTLRVCETA
jgi:hypothetical protein